MNIWLCTMTKDLARRFYSRFQSDPALYLDQNQYKPYVYTVEKSDAAVDRHQMLGRIYLAVMLDEEPVGEIILKHIDRERQHCTLSICLRSDDCKNRGYGTKAEILVLEYAFRELKMKTVYADSIVTNKRSQHVLRKVGFREISRDNSFIYYRCDQDSWTAPQL